MAYQKWKNASNRKEYYAWRSMRARCLNPEAAAWKNYGARGIVICSQWVNDFDTFFEDMGPCPAGHSLDRIDNNAGYSPENCRWADWFTQLNNRRNCIVLSDGKREQTLGQWAAELGIKVGTLHKRLDRMSPERALVSGNLTSLNVKPLVHGTDTAYRQRKCRCDVCRQGNADRHREYMKQRAKLA